MWRIVIPDDDPAVVSLSAAFKKLDPAVVRAYTSRALSEQELIDRIRDAKYVINVRARTLFNRHVLEECPYLKLISIWGTGTDNVDLAAAKEIGIRVTNTPGVSAVAVAEHALMLMLAVARQIVVVDRQVREGKWPRAMVTQLYGKTIGLIGAGAIGREVARLAKGIGCRVIGWTFHPKGNAVEWVDFKEVFVQSDVVSVHLRQSPQTIGMICREHFEAMKPTAIFINTARGAIVNEADLIHALQTRRIAGAGLDVFEKEPLPESSPLLDLSNVVLTPHSAGTTPETTEAGIALAIENILRFMQGEATNVVV